MSNVRLKIRQPMPLKQMNNQVLQLTTFVHTLIHTLKSLHVLQFLCACFKVEDQHLKPEDYVHIIKVCLDL